MTVVLIVLGALAALFVVSGVLPTWIEARERTSRVAAFEDRWLDWITNREPEDRAWLNERRLEMARNARRVGRGVVWVGAPPAVGGPMEQHNVFVDLFDYQSYAMESDAFRSDELATVRHELGVQQRSRLRALANPWAWFVLSFQRVAGLPRYVLRQAGFKAAADSTGARIVTVLWSLLVGVAGIGSFVLALLGARG